MTRLCLFGAAPNTSNLGVSALFRSVTAGLFRRLPELELTVFDYGDRPGRASLDVDGRSFGYETHPAFNSRRYYRRDNLWNMRVSSWLGGAGNRGARAVRQADAVLDVSGGDSFTDLYGPKRFGAISLPKRMTLDAGRPLVLLPQTYGPFTGERSRAIAADIVRRSRLAWARDPQSFDRLKELLGDAFDPQRHRQGVDMAFAMDACLPPQGLLQPLERWLAEASDRPVVGLNVSGLLHNRPNVAREQYGFRADYQQVVRRLARRLLDESPCRLALVPHVVTPAGHYESDLDACAAVADALDEPTGDRVTVLPAYDDPRHIKAVIARLDWFCGTRMHATIAALSSGVPSAAISYSDKTLGVFETCGQGGCVVDPRTLDTDAVVQRVWQVWQERELARERLARHLPDVIQLAQDQLDEVIRSLNLPAGAARSNAATAPDRPAEVVAERSAASR